MPADLLALPRDRPMIEEDLRLLPDCVASLLHDHDAAVRLLPIPTLLRRVSDERTTTWDIPNRTSDAGKALTNFPKRDALFAENPGRRTAALGRHSIRMDGTSPKDALVRDIGNHPFGRLRR